MRTISNPLELDKRIDPKELREKGNDRETNRGQQEREVKVGRYEEAGCTSSEERLYHKQEQYQIKSEFS